MRYQPSKAAILGALSRALDLVEGQPEGHAMRTAQIALEIGKVMGLGSEDREDLFFSAVLKDSGCSNNAVRIAKMFGGDEHLSKRAVKFIDWTSPLESVKFAFQYTEVGQSLVTKLRRMASNIGPPGRVMDQVTEARCTRGAAIASMLSFRPTASDAILYLDEHWDGKGSPYRIAGDAIPLLARILCFCQTYEVFVTSYGIEEARAMAAARSGKWFDPEVVAASEQVAGDSSFWSHFGEEDFLDRELPSLKGSALESDMDAICEAFAMIIDAKSSFTSEHSTRVMRYSTELATCFGISGPQLSELKHASLLHDIGKLGVPTGILEKPGRLDDTEYDRVKLHPKFGQEILGRIPGFSYLAHIASAHHERLDGKGYWQGLGADQLSLDVRIVSACDVFDALSAKRPYRDALPLSQVFEIMEKESGSSLDPECVGVLKELHLGGEAASLAA